MLKKLLMSFRAAKNFRGIVFYGPHACDVCGAMICRASLEQGGFKYDYPQGPIYPNTKWAVHYCQPLPEKVSAL